MNPLPWSRCRPDRAVKTCLLPIDQHEYELDIIFANSLHFFVCGLICVAGSPYAIPCFVHLLESTQEDIGRYHTGPSGSIFLHQVFTLMKHKASSS
jgi:hypothetical protein